MGKIWPVPLHCAKHQGIYNDQYLSCLTHAVTADEMLSILFLKRYFGNEILRFTYFSFFHSNLSNVCADWVQYIIFVSFNRLGITNRNALEITCFTKFNYYTFHLFHKMKIIKFVDLVS